jgi:hypothetical protein
MPIRSRSAHTIQEFVDALEAGTRVIWVANGVAGAVQPDKTILWDDGHHMTRKDMRDHHALLIHSEAERKRLRAALDSRLKCLKAGCNLIHWDDEGYYEGQPERLCPVAVLTAPVSDASTQPHKPRRKASSSSTQPNAA